MLDTTDRQTVREIVREETADMRNDIAEIKTELRHKGVLIEDIDNTVTIILELLVANLDVKAQVEDHEPRITRLETGNKIFASTLRAHSKQLKSR